MKRSVPFCLLALLLCAPGPLAQDSPPPAFPPAGKTPAGEAPVEDPVAAAAAAAAKAAEAAAHVKRRAALSKIIGSRKHRRPIYTRRGDYRDEIREALIWIAAHQAPDGSWDSNGFDLQCGLLGELDPCTGLGFVRHTVGTTGLALLPLIRAGHTPSDGVFRENVERGLAWIAERQEPTGNLGDPRHIEHTYDHFVATLALLEARAASGSTAHDEVIQRALAYMEALRNPGAVWRYADPNEPIMLQNPNDTSVTGWAVKALVLARDEGFVIGSDALDDTYDYLRQVTDAKGRAGYYSAGGGSSRMPGLAETWPVDQTEATTAVAVLSRLLIDPRIKRPDNRAAIDAGVALMLERPIDWSQPSRRDYYYWHHATAALAQLGGKRWRTWRPGVAQIAAEQVRGGEMAGSWDPRLSPWGLAGGRVYSTAILTLTLLDAHVHP